MDLLNALVVLANFVIIPGIAYGSTLALGALGITLIYGIRDFLTLRMATQWRLEACSPSWELGGFNLKEFQ